MTQQTEASQVRERDRRFVRALDRLVPDGDEQRGDRAALAALRRALGKPPGEAPEAFSVVYHALGDEQLTPREEQPYFIVAPLFALYPEGGWSGDGSTGTYQSRSLGASLARLAEATDSGSIEGRFQALLDAHRDDLPEHLRHAVSLCRAHDIPVSWVDLLGDVRHWDHPDRPVQRRWARDYWGYIARAERAAADAETSKDDNDEEDEE
jgi:CRISPR system Cascade subunit CasB